MTSGTGLSALAGVATKNSIQQDGDSTTSARFFRRADVEGAVDHERLGIRKLLGASGGAIVFLLSREFILLITVSYAVALPIAGACRPMAVRLCL